MGRNPKRKSSRGSAPKPPAKRPRHQWTSSSFGQMVEAAGVILSGGQEPNEITVEPAIFQRKLSTTFRRHSDLVQAVEELSEGLLEYIDDPVRWVVASSDDDPVRWVVASFKSITDDDPVRWVVASSDDDPVRWVVASSKSVTDDDPVRWVVASFKSITDDDPLHRFRMCLLPTRIAEGVDVMARSSGLDSLMRLLLAVEQIQPNVANILLEKLPEYMDDAGNMDALDLREYLQMPQLILNQLRWLDNLTKGKELCAKLLEVVGVAPLEIQREIITALPEILDDAQHTDAATELKSLLQTNSDLTAAIIDALSSLNISTDLAAEVLDVALARVASANLSDLPTVIKFVMQQVTPKNSLEIISELRERLDFDSTFIPVPAASSTPRNTQRHSTRVSADTSDQFVVFDTIRSSICFQKAVADGWMKAIESEEGGHKVIDVYVLFILHSIGLRKKAVEALFSSKIKGGHFTKELMTTAFGAHATALREFFPSVLSLCEALLCSSSPSISTFTVSLYQHIFSTFDVYCQQEVIGALITHIGSGMSSEVDHALDALGAIVENQHKAMQRFAILIKGVLDYLEHLNVSQIRKLYYILSVLAFQDPDEASSIQDEMHTVIRKQLTHVEAKYRRMGVMGAVMIIQQLAHRLDDADMTLQRAISSQHHANESTLPPARQKQATSMLDDVMRSCSRSPDSTILFSDEMASVVQRGTLDPAVLRYLSDEATSRFQDIYLIESSCDLLTDLGLPLEFAFGLDSVEEGSIALNVLPMVMRQVDVGEERGAILRGLAAQFRLLRICEQMSNGNLEGIDALLGAPTVLCAPEKLKPSVFEDLPMAKRQDICLSLFHSLNWCRELVCAFAGENDPDMKGKVIVRLRNISDLHSNLEACIAATPGFIPPRVNCEVVTPPPLKSKKGKGGKGDVTLASITCATQNIDKDATTALDKTTSVSAISIDRLRPYFRELELGVFTILHYGPLSRTVVDSDNHTEEREELLLRPPQLCLLLQDLNVKVTSTLSAFGKGAGGKASRGVGSYTCDQLVETMVKLVPALCEHMENTSAFFQARYAENDGVVDMESGHQDYLALCTSLNLLFRNMATFFAWPPLSDPHHEEELVGSVKAIAARTTQSSSDLSSGLPHLALDACKYLERFSEFLPSLTCAHSLAKLLVAMCKACKANHLRDSIASMCSSLLKQSWRATETGQQRNEALEYLLKYHIEWCEDPLHRVETIAGDHVTELLGEGAQEESSAYPTLTNTTFPCYFRCMMSALVSQVKSVPPPKKTSTPSIEVLTDRLHLLEISAKVLFLMVNLVKSFDRRSVLSTALKFGRLYVEAFLRLGMPVLDNLFRSRKNDVIALLKTIQHSTRCLQHFCSHSKVAKDITLTNHVPHLKRSLETLVFRVKEMVTNHNCLEAFWVGNLKNRDLRGQEILSQVPSEPQNGDEEEQSGDDGTNSTSTDRREDEILVSDEED